MRYEVKLFVLKPSTGMELPEGWEPIGGWPNPHASAQIFVLARRPLTAPPH